MTNTTTIFGTSFSQGACVFVGSQWLSLASEVCDDVSHIWSDDQSVNQTARDAGEKAADDAEREGDDGQRKAIVQHYSDVWFADKYGCDVW